MLINEFGFSFLEDYENEDFEVIFLLEYDNAFKPGICLALAYIENEKEEKDYFILFKHIFGSAKKCEISGADAKRIEEIMKNNKIPIVPPEESGLDGHSYVFTFLRNGNFAQYRWWGEPNENWGVFSELIDMVFKYIKNSDGYER